MDLEPRRKTLGKEIYIGLLSSHIQLRKFSVLKIMVSQDKHLCDISYVLSLLLPTHLFVATEMNTGLDGPLVQSSRVLLMSTFVGLKEHQRSINGKRRKTQSAFISFRPDRGTP